MRFRPNKRYTTIAIYTFLVIVAAILFNEGLKNFHTLTGGIRAFFRFIQPVVYGFIFAFLLNPLMRLYDNRLLVFLSRGKMKPRPRRVVALLLTYPTIFILLGLFFRLVIPQLVDSIESLFRIIPHYMTSLEKLYTNLMTNMESMQIINDGTQVETLLSALGEKLIETVESLLSSMYDYLRGLIPQILNAGVSFTTSLINFLLGIIISIYFLYDREKLFAQTKKVASAIFPDSVRDLLYDIALDANRVFSGFIIGKIIDSIIIGILCFFIMWIAGLPFPVLISVIVGVTNVIPYFGPFIGAIPGILLILIVSPMQALLFALLILLLQQFDGNILGPKILGDTTGLSPLWVIFAIMLFSGIFGVLGMFIGVPLFAMIYTLIKRLISFLLNRKDKSTDTRDYASEQNPLIK